MEFLRKIKAKEILGFLIIILLFLILIFPRLIHVEMYHVVSGSMEPAISVGSIVFVKQVDYTEIESGDIITFYGGLGKNTVVTHRVVENQTGNFKLITKGDANTKEDVNPVEYSQIIGKVILTIPYIGNLLMMISSPYVKIVLIVGIVLLFILKRR